MSDKNKKSTGKVNEDLISHQFPLEGAHEDKNIIMKQNDIFGSEGISGTTVAEEMRKHLNDIESGENEGNG